MRVVCYCDYGAYGYCCVIEVINTGAKSGCELVTPLSCLWYDKLWGPSQRVVTLFIILSGHDTFHFIFSKKNTLAAIQIF